MASLVTGHGTKREEMRKVERTLIQRCQATHDQKLSLVVIDDSGFPYVYCICLILGRNDIAIITLGVFLSKDLPW
jgi:hypothetical protein